MACRLAHDHTGFNVDADNDGKVGFHGVTAVVQRAGAAQVVITPTIGAAVATTGSSNSSPYGFTTSAQADALVARVNQLLVDSAAQTVLINELRAALAAKGLIKGAA